MPGKRAHADTRVVSIRVGSYGQEPEWFEVDGVVFGDNTAATRDIDVTTDPPGYAETWSVTHTPTGMAFIGGLKKTVAVALARRLHQLGFSRVDSDDPKTAADELSRLGSLAVVQEAHRVAQDASVAATVAYIGKLTVKKANADRERRRAKTFSRLEKSRSELEARKAKAQVARVKKQIAAVVPRFWIKTSDVHWQSPRVALTDDRKPYASDRAHARVGGCTGRFTLVSGMGGDFQVSFSGHSPDKRSGGGVTAQNCMFIIDNTATLAAAKRAAEKVIAAVAIQGTKHDVLQEPGAGATSPRDVFYAVGTDDARKLNWEFWHNLWAGDIVQVASLSWLRDYKVVGKRSKHRMKLAPPAGAAYPAGVATLKKSASAGYHDAHPDEYFPGADQDLGLEVSEGREKGKVTPIRFVGLVSTGKAARKRAEAVSPRAKKESPKPKAVAPAVELDFLSMERWAEGNPYRPPSDEDLRAHLRRELGDPEEAYVELLRRGEAALAAEAELVHEKRAHEISPTQASLERLQALDVSAGSNRAIVEGGLDQIGAAFGPELEERLRRRLHADLAAPRELLGRVEATGQPLLPGFWPHEEG